MALKPKGSLLVIAAVPAAIALLWSGGSIISARTRTIGPDRIVAFESLPDPDAELCAMPGMEASLPAAIVAMEKVPAKDANLVCALPTASTALSTGADASASLALSAKPALASRVARRPDSSGGGRVTRGAGAAGRRPRRRHVVSGPHA